MVSLIPSCVRFAAFFFGGGGGLALNGNGSSRPLYFTNEELSLREECLTWLMRYFYSLSYATRYCETAQLQTVMVKDEY